MVKNENSVGLMWVYVPDSTMPGKYRHILTTWNKLMYYQQLWTAQKSLCFCYLWNRQLHSRFFWTQLNDEPSPFFSVFVPVLIFLKIFFQVIYMNKLMSPRNELNVYSSQLASREYFLSLPHGCLSPLTTQFHMVWTFSHIPSSYMNHFQCCVLIILYKVTF